MRKIIFTALAVFALLSSNENKAQIEPFYGGLAQIYDGQFHLSEGMGWNPYQQVVNFVIQPNVHVAYSVIVTHDYYSSANTTWYNPCGGEYHDSSYVLEFLSGSKDWGYITLWMNQ